MLFFFFPYISNLKKKSRSGAWGEKLIKCISLLCFASFIFFTNLSVFYFFYKPFCGTEDTCGKHQLAFFKGLYLTLKSTQHKNFWACFTLFWGLLGFFFCLKGYFSLNMRNTQTKPKWGKHLHGISWFTAELDGQEQISSCPQWITSNNPVSLKPKWPIYAAFSTG